MLSAIRIGKTPARALRQDARSIIAGALKEVQPGKAVRKALEGKRFPGRVLLIAAGKAAWQMAAAASGCIGEQMERGVVVTKYGHVQGPIARVMCCEGGHPVPDEGSFRGTETALRLTEGLTEKDTILFLLSGGGSSLFEKPLTTPQELESITRQLLASGADITEINVIRKRLSAVKGGRFAQLCAPAQVFSIVLSDVLGDALDAIASGPACPDSSTSAQAREIAKKYRLSMSRETWALLDQETPKKLDNVEAHITGSVRELCGAAAKMCGDLGYAPCILTDRLCCQAREAGSFLASIARSHADSRRSLAFLAGGETVVRLTGGGKGGRNQELALSAAAGIAGLKNVLIFSLGSDGTDGPTDAAGGIVDGNTAGHLIQKGISIFQTLEENDAYHALSQAEGLIFTGPTGTNVNDVAVVLVKGSEI